MSSRICNRQGVNGRRTGRLAGFATREDGSFIILGLYLLIAMLLVGGVAVDIVRHDYERLRMQGTVDAAVLAAADLDQTLDPEAVVRDYFDKAGILDRLDDVSVTSELNSRAVTARSSMDVETMFINAIGIDTLRAGADGTAREGVSDIEVSLVLDISGSMAEHSRIGNLKTAAKDFVDTVLADDASTGIDDVSISIVPYATEVAIGSRMLSLMPHTKAHGYSHCINLAPSDFDVIAMDLGASRSQTAHFDPWDSGTTYSARAPRALNLPCRVDAASGITYFSQDQTRLKQRIDALQPGGNTSIDVGLKWGAALLDPSMRPAIASLATGGEADPVFSDRPLDHDRENSMKILVVMTDGENTTQYKLKDAYSGDTPSDVYAYYETQAYDPRDNGHQLSVFSQSRRNYGYNEWWITSREFWSGYPWGGAAARRLSWQEVWSISSLGWHAYWARYKQSGNADVYYAWRDNVYTTIGPTTKNARMQGLCRKAKEKGIIIFSIALDIDEGQSHLMEECASTANHYFNVRGTELNYAFSAIASNINQLRLVQ